MKTKAMGILGPEGWVRQPQEILSKAFLHILGSDKSQSNIFYGSVTSLQAIYAESRRGNETVDALRTKLTEYYMNFFDVVEVEVNDISKYEEKARQDLEISVIVQDGSEKYSLAASLIGTPDGITLQNALDIKQAI